MIRCRWSNTRYRRAGRIAAAINVALCLACAPSPDAHPPVYPVHGKVLYKGKPIAGGVVTYEREGSDAKAPPAGADGGPLRATGRIETDGSFRLTAFAGAEGVPEGAYVVGISSRPPHTEAGLLGPRDGVKKGDPDVLRGRYADPRTSGLRAEVRKDAPNEPTFDLK